MQRFYLKITQRLCQIAEIRFSLKIAIKIHPRTNTGSSYLRIEKFLSATVLFEKEDFAFPLTLCALYHALHSFNPFQIRLAGAVNSIEILPPQRIYPEDRRSQVFR